METKVFELKEGGRNSAPLKFPEMGTVGNVTLKRGLVRGPHADALFKWHVDVMRGEFDASNNPNRRKPLSANDIDKRCAIVLQDSRGQEIRRWCLVRAFPVKWGGPELKAMGSDVALETLELACEGVELG
jgi:phage tail-like protein